MTKKSKIAPQNEAPVDTQTEAKAPAAPKTRGPRGTEESAVIHLLAQVNPKRAGSKAAQAFAVYVDGMTVKEYCDGVDAFAKGEGTPNLVYDAKHGFISIDGYDPGAIIVAKPKAEKVAKEPKAPRAKKEKAPKAEPSEEQAALAAETQTETME